MVEAVVYYKVLHNYTPSQDWQKEGYLTICKDDIIETESSLHGQARGDWLHGRLQKTGEVGLFPANYVEKMDAPPRPVPLPRHKSTKHHLDGVYFRTPMLCSHCNDYIWGEGKVGKQCQGCLKCFHSTCESLILISCPKDKRCDNDNEVYSKLQMVKDWNIEEVTQWMAVVNLHRYSQIFMKNRITGEALLRLTESRIKEMNIKDEFHFNSILACVEVLKKPQDNHMNLPPGSLTLHHNHKWSTYTFTTMQKCHFCSEFLYGIVQQGFQCISCGFCCHRKCSFHPLPQCIPSSMRSLRRSSFNSDSAFGRALKEFSEVPLVLVQCANSLEARANRGSDLLSFYRKTPATCDVNSLKNLFDQNLENIVLVDMKQFEGSVVGGVIKKFLRDLPDPVIPENDYSAFINLDEGNRCELVDGLPDIHRKTLKFLIGHLVRDGQDNIRKLARIFCQILMRPPWNRIMDIVSNVDVQVRSIELLLKIPDNDIQSPQPLAMPESLENALWYWEDISREEVNEKMLNTPDGTYLVRNSTTREENAPFTLTLRKSCKNMLIKIYYSRGKYGLMESMEFDSLQDLISFYSNHSLVDFNSNLNITLQYPIQRQPRDCKRGDNTDLSKLREELKNLYNHRKISELVEKLEELHYEEDELREMVKMKQAAINAFKQVCLMYSDQIDAGANFRPSAISNDIKKVSSQNSDTMKEKLKLIERNIRDLESDVALNNKKLADITRELEIKKPELNRLTQERDLKMQMLIDCGESPENIELLQQGRELVTIPHLDQSKWLCSCDRFNAEKLLKGKRVGTFLIRPKEEKSYALTIVPPDKLKDQNQNQPGLVVHCMIDQKETGFGFAEPFYIHQTLLDLVLHYKETSLVEHNDQLDVTLEYPVYA